MAHGRLNVQHPRPNAKPVPLDIATAWSRFENQFTYLREMVPQFVFWNRTLNIILAIPEFPPDTSGGGGIVAAALYEQYSRRHRVMVVTGKVGYAVVPKGEDPAILRVGEFPFPRGLPFMASTMPPNVAGFATLRKLASVMHKFDVVHSHGYGFPIIDAVSVIAQRADIPIVHTLHGYPVTPARRGGAVRLAFSAYGRILGDPALKRARAHTAVSQSVGAFYKSRYDLDCRIIPNGISALPLATADSTAGQRFVVLCVGRLEWIKRFDTVIRAVAKLPPNVELWIAGRDNGDKSNLEAIASQVSVSARVRFLGFLGPQELSNAYASADCCVMASETEAFPAVPLEAMKAGVPIIATPVGGVNEYAEDNENILIFPVGDVTSLVAQISRVIADAALRERLATGGIVTANRYRWSEIAENYETLLRSVI